MIIDRYESECTVMDLADLPAFPSMDKLKQGMSAAQSEIWVNTPRHSTAFQLRAEMSPSKLRSPLAAEFCLNKKIMFMSRTPNVYEISSKDGVSIFSAHADQKAVPSKLK